jgi:hypothetical protein
MGRDLLCKLRAQITFDSNGMAALQLRGPKTRVLTLTVTEEEELPLREGLLRRLSFPLRFQVYGLKITPRSGPKCSPVMVELKPGATPPAKTVLHSPQGPGQNSKKL